MQFLFLCVLLFLHQTAASVPSSSSGAMYGSGGGLFGARPRNSLGPQSGSYTSSSQAPSSTQSLPLSTFATRDSRNGFIRKVYSIFLVQMVSTIGVTAAIMQNDDLKHFLLRHYPVIGTASTLLSAAAALLLVGSKSLRQTAPANLILLGIYTLMQSVTVGTFSSLVNPRTVCLGTMHTLSALAALTLYSFNAQRDLTTAGSTLLACSATGIVGLVLSSVFHMPLMDNLISAGLAVLFAAYLAYDTQMIVGGHKRKNQYDSKEYILAALSLYQDVIALFMQVMRILIWLDEKQKNRYQRQQ